MTPSRDVAELRHQIKLIWYFSHHFPPRLSTDSLLANLRASTTSYTHFVEAQSHSNLPTMFKMTNICSGFSKIYKRVSPNIRLIPNLTLVSMLTGTTDHMANSNL